MSLRRIKREKLHHHTHPQGEEEDEEEDDDAMIMCYRCQADDHATRDCPRNDGETTAGPQSSLPQSSRPQMSSPDSFYVHVGLPHLAENVGPGQSGNNAKTVSNCTKNFSFSLSDCETRKHSQHRPEDSAHPRQIRESRGSLRLRRRRRRRLRVRNDGEYQD